MKANLRRFLAVLLTVAMLWTSAVPALALDDIVLAVSNEAEGEEVAPEETPVSEEGEQPEAPAPEPEPQPEPVAEEPAPEAPAAEEPVAEEPVAEEPVAEEPVAEEPVAEEPVAEEPVAEEPVAEEPVKEEPVAEEPVVEEEIVEEPVVEEEVLTKETKAEAKKADSSDYLVTLSYSGPIVYNGNKRDRELDISVDKWVAGSPGNPAGYHTYNNYGVRFYLVGSATPVDFINAGTYRIELYDTADDSEDYGFVFSDSYTVTIVPAETRVTSGITAEDKVYDGTNAATLNYDNVNFSFMLDKDREDVTVTATGNFQNSSAGEDIEVSITGITLSGPKAGNYKLTSTTLTGVTADITPAMAAVTWSGSDEFTYGEVTTNDLPKATLDGVTVATTYRAAGSTAEMTATEVKNADAGRYVAVATAENYTITNDTFGFEIKPATAEVEWSNLTVDYNKTEQAPEADAGEGVTLTVKVDGQAKQTNAGTYTAVATTTSPNYTLTNAQATFKIKPATLTVTALNAEKYATLAEPVLKYQVNGGSEVVSGSSTSVTTAQGDTVAVTAYLDRVAGEEPGETYAIYVDNMTVNSDNYVLASTNGTLTVKECPTYKAVWQGTSSDAAITKPYDGSNQQMAAVMVDGTGAAITDYTVTYSNNGEWKNVGVYTAKLHCNLDGSDWTLEYVITKAPLTVKAVAKTKVYDGKASTDPELTFTVESQDTTPASTGALEREPGQDVGAYAIKQGTLSFGDNYEVAFTGAEFTITEKELKVTAVDAGKIYGEADPKLTCTVDGEVEGDGLVYDVVRAAGEAVKADGYEIDVNVLGAKARNYTVKVTKGTFTISKKNVTVNAVAKTKEYDGKTATDPALTYTVSGLVGNDTLEGALTREAGQEAGTYAIQQGTVVGGDNYEVTFVGADFVITKIPLTVTAKDASKVYGESDPTLTCEHTGDIQGESLTYTVKREDGNDVGTYDIDVEVTGDKAKNYNITINKGTFTITPAEIEVTTKDATKYVGYADPAFEVEVAEDAPAAVKTSIQQTAVMTREPGEEVGQSYTIYLAYADAGTPNYTIKKVNTGKLTIKDTPDNVVVKLAEGKDSFVYNGSAQKPQKSDFTVTVAGEAVDFTLDYDDAESTDVGKYKIRVNSTALGFKWDEPIVYQITPAEVTLSIGDFNLTKAYDGTDAAPNAFNAAVTVTGKKGDDDVYAEVVAANYSDAKAETGKTITVKLSKLMGDDKGNYKLTGDTTFTVNNGVIEKVDLEITADSKTKVYGDADPELTWKITKGSPVGSDVITGGLKRSSSSEDAKVYTGDIVADDLTVTNASNYNYTFVPGNFEITKKSVNVAGIRAENKVYDGNTDATLILTGATIDGIVGEDVLTVSATGAFEDATVGNGKTVKISDLALEGDAVANYVLGPAASQQRETSADITPRELKIVESSVTVDETKEYDGTDSASWGFTGSLDGLVGDDDVGVDLSAAEAHYEDKNVGTDKNVYVVGFALTGDDAGNYYLSTTEFTKTADITPITVTVSGIEVVDKEYDGNDAAELNLENAVLSGVLDGDDVGIDGSGKFSQSAASDDELNVTPTLSLTGSDAGNYELDTTSLELKGMIERKALIPVGINAAVSDKPYDGNDTATLNVNAIQLIGKVRESDDVYVSSEYTATFEDANVGANKEVTVSGLKLEGSSSANYRLFDTEYLCTATIYEQEVEVVVAAGIKANDKTYDGNAIAELDISTAEIRVKDGNVVSGLKLADDYIATFADKNVGDKKTVTVSNMHLTSDDPDLATNYKLADGYTIELKASITQANLKIVADSQSKVYDNDPNTDPFLTWYVSEGDVYGSDYIVGFLAREDGQNKGEYAINEGDLMVVDADDPTTASGNYNVTVVTDGAVFTIAPRTVNIAGILGVDKTYDGTAAATLNTDGATFAGIVDGDKLTVTATGTFGDKNVGDNKVVTIDPESFVLDGDSAANYELGPVDAQQKLTTADITPLDVTITGIAVNGKTYDGSIFAAVNDIDLSAATIEGKIDNDDVSINADGLFGAYDNKNVGTQTVSVFGLELEGNDAGNYNLTETYWDVSNVAITEKTVTVSGLQVVDKVYDTSADAPLNFNDVHGDNDEVIIPAATIEGALSTDDVYLTGSANYADGNVDPNGKNVTSYTIELAGDDADNYELDTSTIGTLSGMILPLELEVTGLRANDKPYDGTTDATLDITNAQLVGVLGQDDVSLDTADTKVEFEQPEVGTDIPVYFVQDLALKGAQAGNYVLPDMSSFELKANITVQNVAIVDTTPFKVADKVYDASVMATITNLDEIKFITADGTEIDADIQIDPDSVEAEFEDKDVGEGKTVNITGLRLTGDDAIYYTLSNDTATATASITAKEVTIDGVYLNSKEYDGNTDATIDISFAEVIGAEWLDDVEVDDSEVGEISFDEKNVGERTATVSGLKLKGDDADNYVLPEDYKLTLEAEIWAKPISVHLIAADDMVYDGTCVANLNFEDVVLQGLVDGDDVSVDAIALYADENVADNKLAIISGIWLDGEDADNYYVSDDSQKYVIGAITPLYIDVVDLVANDKEYDGNVDATLDTSNATLDGVLDGDDLTLASYAAAGAFEDAEVGEDKDVTVGGLTLDGVDRNNYKLNPLTVQASITPKTLKVVNVKAANKTYDGTTDAEITRIELEGAVSGEVVSVAEGYTAEFDTKDVGEGKTVTVTGITLEGDDAANYVLDANQVVTTEANISIRKVTLKDIVVESKEYDGNAVATFTSATIDDDVAQTEGITVTTNDETQVLFGDKKAGNGKTVSISGLVLEGDAAANYELDKDTYFATADITRKALTATGVTVPTREYDGSPEVVLECKDATLETPIDNDEVFVLSGKGYYNDGNAQPNKTVINPVLVLGGADANNYTVEFSEVLTGQITKKTLTVDGIIAEDKPYDGKTEATIDVENAVLVGVIDADVGKVLLDTTNAVGEFEDAEIGSNKKVTIFGLELYCEDPDYNYSTNYKIVDPLQVEANIYVNALVEIVGVQGEAVVIDKVYDGNTIATLNLDNLTLTNVADGDDVSIAGDSYVARYEDANAGENKTVTVSNMRLTGADAYKYKLEDTYTFTLEGNILQKEVKVVGIEVVSKEYDGETTATVSYDSAVVTDIIGNDDVQVDASKASAAYADKNVGTGKAVTVTGLALKGDDVDNYKLPDDYEVVLTGDITAKPVTVSGITVAARDYDGTDVVATEDLSEPTIATVVGEDKLTATVTGVYTDKNAAADKLVFLTIALDGDDKDNYTLADDSQTTAKGTINKLDVKVEGIVAEDKTYDATTYATLDASAATFTTLIAADDGKVYVSSANGEFASAGASEDAIEVTISDIVLGGEEAGNYAVSADSQTTAEAKIEKADLHIFPISNWKFFGDADPALEYTATGFKGTDDYQVITGALTRDQAGTTEGENVGEYAISIPDTMTADNYTLVNDNATAVLTIRQRIVEPTIVITEPADGFVYRGTAYEPNPDGTDGKVEVYDDNGELVDPSEYTLEYTNNVNAGTATVTVVGKSNGNYSIHRNSQNFTITPAALTIVPKDVTVTWAYTWVEPSWNAPEEDWYEVTGLVNNEVATVQMGRNGTTHDVKDSPFEDDLFIAGVSIKTATGENVPLTNYDITMDATADFIVEPLKVKPTILLTDMDFGNDPDYTAGDDRGFTYTGQAQKPSVTLLDEDGNEIPYTQGNDSEYKWEVVTESDSTAATCIDSTSYKVVIIDENLKGNYEIDVDNVQGNPLYKIYPLVVEIEWDQSTLSLVYNGNKQTPTAKVKGFDDVEVNVEVLSGDGTNVKNNPHTARAYGFKTTQLNLAWPATDPTVNYEITPATLTITPSDPSTLEKTYGEEDAEMPYTNDGIVTPDEQKVLVTGKLTRAEGENAGEYALLVSDIDVVNKNDNVSTGNYDIVLDPNFDVYTINRKDIEVAFSNTDLSITAEGWTLDNSNVFHKTFNNTKIKPDNLKLVDNGIVCSKISDKTIGAAEYTFDWENEDSIYADKYTFKVVDALVDAGNYNITSKTLTYKIDPIEVALDWSNGDHLIYNGFEQIPSVTLSFTAEGFAPSDLEPVVLLLSDEAIDVNLKTGADDSTADPKYKAQLSKLVYKGSDTSITPEIVKQNFHFDEVNAVHEFYITPAPLTLTIEGGKKFYKDDEPTELATMTADPTQLMADDVLDSYSFSRVGGEVAGEYLLTVESYTLFNTTRNKDVTKNYDVTFDPAEAYFTIEPKPVTVDDTMVEYESQAWTYNGTFIEPPVKVYDTDGQEIPDTEYTVEYYDNVDHGTGMIYLRDVDGGNYALNFSTINPLTFIINQKTVELTWDPAGDAEYPYDGDWHMPTAVVSEDSLCTRYDGTVASGKKDVCDVIVVGQEYNAGTYYAEAASLSNDNYKLPELRTDRSKKFVITPMEVTVSGITASDKVYDGYTFAKLDVSNAVVSPVLAGDEVIVTATGEFEDKNVGDDKNVNVTVKLEGRQGANYTATSVDAVTASITPATLTIEAMDRHKIYNEADPALTYHAIGFKGEDTKATVMKGALEREAGEDIGMYEILQGTLTAEPNYTIEYNSGIFRIYEKIVEEAFIDVEPATLIYNGAERTAENGSIKVSVYADAAKTELIPDSEYRIIYEDNKYVGTATLYIVGKAPGNYMVVHGTATFTIIPADLTVTADNLTKIYSYPDPELTYKVEGLQGSDTAEKVLTGKLERDPGENVGVYAIKKGTLAANENYNLIFVPGTLTIVAKKVTVQYPDVTIHDVPRIYNGQKHTPPITVKVAGETIPSNEYSVYYENNIDAGTAEVTLTDIPGGNYDLTFDVTPKLTFDILPKEVGLVWAPLTFIYDGKLHCPSATATGLVGDDECLVSVSYNGEPINAGTYTAFATDLSNKNYRLPANNSTEFKILPKPVTVHRMDVTLEKKVYTYDGTEHCPAVSITVDGELIPENEYAVTYKDNIHAGKATVILTNVEGNYDLTFDINPPVTFTIKQRVAKLSWAPLKFEYDGKAHLPKATVTNLVEGDVCKVTVKADGAKAINIGTYKAKATKLSNKDYKLPSKKTKKFKIVRPTIDGTLILKMMPGEDKSIVLSWTKISNVDGYDVFMSLCNDGENVYTPVLVKIIEGNKTHSWTATGLNKDTCYKAYVCAYVIEDGEKKYVRTSMMAHCISTGSTRDLTNPGKLTLNTKELTMEVGDTFTITGVVEKLVDGKTLLHHTRDLRFITNYGTVATVNKKGVVKAVRAGTCKITVITNNGLSQVVKVKVK